MVQRPQLQGQSDSGRLGRAAVLRAASPADGALTGGRDADGTGPSLSECKMALFCDAKLAGDKSDCRARAECS